jgi:tetratricopeptide (TPR) repeat protein
MKQSQETLASAPGASAAPASDLPLATAVGRYQLQDELARGGMGIVYRAIDNVLGREVAVKVLQPGYATASAVARRFVDEARITGQLQHPGVPAVHDLGALPDGRPFLAMKLIKGCTLKELLRQRDEPLGQRGRLVAVFEQVCQAVAYAHAHGVIHRDLKPDNVMVGAFGEVQVMDWGLAKLLTDTAPGGAEPAAPAATIAATAIQTARELDDATRAGSVLGTPAYMPPEQAIGAVDQIDARSDVFGLGAILCTILTGRPPYVGADSEATRQLAARAKLDDAFVRLDACGAEPELVALCKRCLAPERDDRPQHGGELAKVVAGLRAAAEERARQAELDRVRAEGDRKRRRVLIALAASTGLLLFAGVGFAWWQDRQATERRTEQALKVQQVRDALPPLLALAVDLRRQAQYPEAAAALDRAAQLLTGGDAPELCPDVEQARADLAFTRDLDNIYSQYLTLVQFEGGRVDFDRVSPPRLYRAAFLARDFDFAAAPPVELARRVTASAIRRQLIEGLDFWAVHEPDRVLGSRVLDVLRRVDPGPWLDRLRDPAVREDNVKLAELVRDADPATIPVIYVGILSRLTWERGIDSIALVRAAYRFQPTDFVLNHELGIRYWHRGDAKQGVGYLRAARAVRPANVGVLTSLARAQAAADDHDGAIATCEEAVRHDRTPWALVTLGQLLSRIDTKRSHAAFREALRIDPSFPGAHDGIAFTLRLSGDIDGAIQYLREAITSLPEAACLQRHLGWVLCKTKYDYVAGLPQLRDAVRLDAKDAQNHFELGECLLDGALADKGVPGRLREAIQCFREAIRLDPWYALAHANLGWSLHLKGELDEALRHCEQAARLDEQTGWIQQSLATVRKAKAARDAGKAPPGK